MRNVLSGHLKIWFEGFLIAVFIGFGLLIVASIFEIAVMENCFQIYVFVAPIIILGRSIRFLFKNVILGDNFAGEKVVYLLFAVAEIVIVLGLVYMAFMSFLVMIFG